MAWLFTGVLNAGLQILLAIFGGWLCAKLKLVDPEVMSRNVNAFAMKAAYPAFIIHLLGVKTDLRDQEAWRALGVFVLWVLVIHMGCFIVHKLQGQRSSVRQLGLNCLLLSTNNTGCIGWPVLIATVGPQNAVLSMLLGVLFFIQLLPVTVSCFEHHKWQQQALAQPAGDMNDVHGDQLPVSQCDKDQQRLALVPAPPKAFPHEFRYCYWSNELYQPRKPSSYSLLHSTEPAAAKPPAALAEVCVESGSEDGDDDNGNALDHHCFGGGSRTSSSINNNHNAQTVQDNPSAAARGASTAAGREWWRSGRPKVQGGGLKRAKDSCDSLYTPFAAAAVATKQQQEQLDQQQARPSSLGLSSLTRRLSKGLSAAAAAAAAAPAGLVKAASLHTANSLKRAASLKPAAAASLRRPAACQLSTPLMLEHADGPLSCCPSHRAESPPAAAASPQQAVADGGSTHPAAPEQDRRSSTSGNSSRGSSSAGGSSLGCNSSSDGGCSSSGDKPGPEAAEGRMRAAAAAGRLSRLPGMVGPQMAADSAVELHFMCQSLCDADGKPKPQQLQDSKVEAVGLSGAGQVPAAAASLPSRGSAAGLHTLCSNDDDMMCGRLNSDTGRATSRTNLLLLPSAGGRQGGAAGNSVRKGTSRLEKAAAGTWSTGSASAQGSKGQGLGTRGDKSNVLTRFVSRHPLLCHIVWGQMQSFHLWLNVVAIALSVSGARKYLDPQSPQAIAALGFVDGVLSWFSAACIPTLLFANGVWMCGKDVLCGGWRGQLKVLSILLLKLTLLPALMIGLTQLCNVKGEYGLSLVLLASCPLAPLAFLVCQQYGFGAELVTSITIQGVLLMLPQMMAVIKVNQIGHLYDVELLGA